MLSLVDSIVKDLELVETIIKCRDKQRVSHDRSVIFNRVVGVKGRMKYERFGCTFLMIF